MDCKKRIFDLLDENNTKEFIEEYDLYKLYTIMEQKEDEKWVCKICNTRKTADDFYDTNKNWCKICLSLRHRKYLENKIKNGWVPLKKRRFIY